MDIRVRFAFFIETFGVQVAVRNGATFINPKADGGLGRFHPKTRLDLVLGVKKRRNLMPLVFHRHQRKDGSHEFWSQEAAGASVETVRYVWGIHLQGEPPHGRTQWPQNQLHVLIQKARGAFELWQISLPAQKNVIYLRVQRLYEGKVEKMGNQFVVADPHFAPWENLVEHLAQEMRYRKLGVASQSSDDPDVWDWVDGFAPSVRSTPPPRFVREDLMEGQGVVQFWNDSMGQGWAVARVNGQNAQAKVHWSAVQIDGFRHLEDGGLVTFDQAVEETHKAGPDAGMTRYELKGVRPL